MGLFGGKKPTAVDIAAQQREREQLEVEQEFLKGVRTLRDLIAPSSLEITTSYFRLGTKYGRTLYVYAYPRQLIGRPVFGYYPLRGGLARKVHRSKQC